MLCAIGVVAAAVSGYAFAHAFAPVPTRPTAVGRLTKNAWLGISGSIGSVLPLVAALRGAAGQPNCSGLVLSFTGIAQQHDAYSWLAGPELSRTLG